MTYPDRLRLPQWQKKRLQVLKRDKFTCLLCRDKETELQVHHLKYEFGRDPWEYELTNFQTLCKYCHKICDHVKGFKESPTKVIRVYAENYIAFYVYMSDESVIRYTYDEESKRFVSGGIFTSKEIKELTAKKR